MRKWLKDMRLSEELSQKELAEIIGVDSTTIGKYEIGERTPSPKIAKKIAEYFDFEWTKFFD